jgi:hypothetical protein
MFSLKWNPLVESALTACIMQLTACLKQVLVMTYNPQARLALGEHIIKTV